MKKRVVLGTRVGARALPLGVGLALAAALIAGSTAQAATTKYAIGKAVCQTPKPKFARCHAMRRVLVSRSTPGARAFQSAAGAATPGPAGGLTPAELATAYGFNPAATPSSPQTVAIVDAFNDPTIESDLAAFNQQYLLPPCTTANGCFTKVNQDGNASPLPPANTGWATEIALDVETVHAVCQKCKILLVEANSNSFANLEAATNRAAAMGATEISNSYGGAVAPNQTDLAAYNHPGIVVTASTGDDGWFDFDQWLNNTNSSLPAFPASSNAVVAVGGTSLYLDQNANRQSEVVWNNNGTKNFWEDSFGVPLGATGGGCSASVQAQTWQKNLPVWSSTLCGQFRLPADISSDADPLTGFDIYDTTGGSGWGTIGGTSFSSPTIAAMFALAGGAKGVSNPGLTLYGHFNATQSLYDVTSGGNGWCGGVGASQCGNPNTLGHGRLDCDYPASGNTPSAGIRACDAAVGYDGPSGLGTPIGLGVFAKVLPTAAITGPMSVTKNVSNVWSATTSDPFPAGKITAYDWGWGDNTAHSGGVNPSHTYTSPGSKTITLTVADNYGQKATAKLIVTVS